MGLFAQIALLFWKNLIVMWRSKLWLIAEIIFSLFLLPYIIAVVRYAPAPSKEDAYSFSPFFIAGNSSDIDKKINNSASIDTYYNCHHDITLGYSYEPGLAELANKLMAKVREHYTDNMTMQIEIQNFTTVKQMIKLLESDLNATREEMCGEFLGGIHFTNIRLQNQKSEPQLIYRILLPKRNTKWQMIDSFWLEDDPNGPQSDHNQIPSEPPYWQSGFLSIQYAIETTFLDMNNGNNRIKGFSMNNSIFSFLRIPIDQSSSGSMILFLKYMYIFWLIAMMGIMLHTAKNIVLEKEAGIKTYMSVMGLQPMAFYYSHIIIGFLKAALVMILCTSILCKGLNFTSPTIFIFFSIFFDLTMVILSALISAIVKTPQLTQFMANLIPALLLVLSISGTPSISRIDLCLLSSLNPITAFKLGVAHIVHSETKMIQLSWTSILQGCTTQFTIGWAMFMLIFDCILFTFLIYYVDAVLPTDGTPKKHPLFFLEYLGIPILKREHSNYMGDEEMDSNAVNDNMEQEHGSLEEADIIVNHMSKNWGGGNLAVDKLNFRAYRGQLTVLLGHNGAGKTTTFSVLIGSIDCSDGQVLICQKDLKQNLHECQKNIGYCPQNNPLFDKLNVKEHLKLYAGLKTGHFYGPMGWKALEQEIIQIVKDVGLMDKMDIEAQNLSGGQKRKLCVAISLIAGSKVVLLDEPTAGMDPEARNEIGKLLSRAKKERTILLTTHYMEEADLLGDRIGIMVNGRLVCNGSPEFLKKKFGAGYILSFVSTCFDSTQNEISSDNIRLFNQTISRILGVVRKYSPNARVGKAQRPPEFTIILPTSDKRHYANLFEELENGKILLGISSFGLSLNTLEQVFLRVGEIAEPEETDQTDGPSSAQKLAKDLFGIRQQQFHIIGLLFHQLAALFYRHLLWTLRNPMRSLLPLAIAILSFIFLGFIFKPSSPLLHQNRSLSLDNAHEKMRIPMQIRGKAAEKHQQKFIELSKSFCSNCLFIIDPKKDLHDELKKELINSPSMVAGIAIYENASTGKLEIEALFNGIAVHSPPMALSFITNALLGVKKFSIRPTIEIYDVPSNSNGTIDDETFTKIAADFINNAIVSAVIIMCFSIFGATMVVPLVEEKSGKFKHQLMLTKLHILTYWFSVYLWNLVFYILFCTILAIFFLYFGWMKDCIEDLFLLWILYFWAYVPMNGVVSFIFDKPQRAFTAVLSWNMVASMLFLLASTFMAFVFNLREIAEVMDTLLYLLTPAYALGSGVLQILLHCFAFPLDNYDDWYLKKHFEMMILSGIIFWSILAILQSRILATKFHQLSCQLFHRHLYQRIFDLDEEVAREDEDIRNERERLDKQESRMFALTVRNLSKYYGQFPAVRNLTFGIKQKECFGLLGVNGAGKTTTFDILTGVRFATSGNATVGGINVNKAPAIGYCPQFDALPMELTGREVLTLLAHLNDFSDVKTRVNQIIWSIRMEKHADKKIMNYSGGQRRRISIGITLVTRSYLIMLDEPTAGIDPKTRRQIWQLLQAIRQQGIAILLTSHSMDECEELCNKIGFLNRGRLVGIGSSQHLKSRFGNSYLLTITIANPTSAVLAHLNNKVVENFNALPTEDPLTSSTLHWEVPKRENVSWSWLYKKAHKLADLYPDEPNLSLRDSDRPKIVDFSLTQNSLEQVFLRLSKNFENSK